MNNIIPQPSPSYLSIIPDSFFKDVPAFIKDKARSINHDIHTVAIVIFATITLMYLIYRYVPKMLNPKQTTKVGPVELKPGDEIQKRDFPSPNPKDTTRGDGTSHHFANGKPPENFADDVIVEKETIIKKVMILEATFDKGSAYVLCPAIYATYTKYNKTIIKQLGIRACTAACAAMLIVDHNKKPNGHEMQPNLGGDDAILRAIKEAGLTPLETSTTKDLKSLRDAINKNGPAIVSVDPGSGGHVIVVDDISEDLKQVRLRDPWHGWEITIKAEAFEKAWSTGNSIIQIPSSG